MSNSKFGLRTRKGLIRSFVEGAQAVLFDADALAYITANTAITSTADKNAITTFFLGLKSDGIYTKMKAMYLPIWGTSANCKFNLIAPNGSYDLTFITGWTFSSTGMTTNGATYANTNLTPSSINQNSQSLTAYIRLDRAFTLGTADVGYNYISASGTTFSSPLNISPNYIEVSSTITSKNGYFIGNRTSSTNISLYKNSTKLTNVTANSGTGDSVPIYIGALNRNTYIYYPLQSNEFAFVSIGEGLTDAEATNLNNRVNTLMTYFGINI